MPALRIIIDGVPIATVCTNGYDVLSARAFGTRIDDDLATFDVSGGSYPEGGPSTHLTWVSELPLRLNQKVTVSFLETAPSSHAGKTIDELYPDEPPLTQADFKPTAEIFADIRSSPKLRDKFSFRLELSPGTVFVGDTTPDEYSFAFTVLWNSYNPASARVSLTSNTIDGLEARLPLRYHVEERILYGGSVSFEIVA